MSVSVDEVQQVVSHYVGLLAESKAAREVIESWGLEAGKELQEAAKVADRLVTLMAQGTEVI